MPSRNTIEIIINAIDDTGDAFGGINVSLGNIIGAAATAAAGVAAAFTGVAAIGLNEFRQFERGMNEVFTLLPGISQEAMGQMEDQVKDLATTMGVLPEKVIPALYQSLSAGVPPDNVFDFLETAQQAAIGGVSTLETAVNGLTSVVNAYGSDVISSQRASDLMFTTVRLGKTTFDELSASLFNVLPTASATSVGFEQISAALASITLQGTPTSVATTQLRQMLVELSKDGSGVAEVFERISGQSFKDFMSSGGSLETVLFRLGVEAKNQGKSLSDLFSSVEAGNAALALTGPGAEAFASALSEMADSAGATQAAYDQMNQGLDRSLENMGAAWSVFVTTLGEDLAPIVGPIIDVFTNLFRYIGAAIGDGGDMLNDWLTHLPEPLRGIATAIASVINWFIEAGKAIGRFIGALSAGVAPIDAFKQLMLDLLPREIAVRVNDLIDGIVNIVKAVKDWADANPELVQNLLKIAAAAAIGIPVFNTLRNVFDQVKTVVSALRNPTLLAGGALLGLVVLSGQGDELAAALGGIVDGFTALASGNYEEGIAKIKDGLNQLGEVAKNTVLGLADWVLDELGRIFNFDPPSASEGLQRFAQGIQDAFLAVQIILDRMTRGLDRFFLDAEIEIYKLVAAAQQVTGVTLIPNVDMRAQYAVLARNALDIADQFEASIHSQLAGKSPMDVSGDLAYATSAQAAQDFGVNTAKLIADSLSEEAQRLLPQSIETAFIGGDQAALGVQIPILANLNVDHQAMILQMAQHIQETEGEIAAMGFLETVGIPLLTDLDIPTSNLVSQFRSIVSNAASSTTYQATATASVTVNAGAVNTSNFVATVGANIRNVLGSLGQIAQNPVGAFGNFLGNLQNRVRGSYASGTNYVPSTGLYQLHEGEQVIPKGDANRNTTINVNFTGTGAPQNQQEAENVSYMIVQGLRTRGVEV